MSLAVVALSIIALAFLFIFATVVYGMVLALVAWFGDLADRAHVGASRLNPFTPRADTDGRRSLGSAPPRGGDLQDFSAEAMWARMQGTSSGTSRKLRREARKR